MITLSNKSYLVVGVYEDPNAGTATYGTTSGGNAIMTNTQVASEFGVKKMIKFISILMMLVRPIKLVRKQVQLSPRYLELKMVYIENYNMDNIVKQANQMASMYTIAFGVIAGISLLVGGIGVIEYYAGICY